MYEMQLRTLEKAKLPLTSILRYTWSELNVPLDVIVSELGK